MPQAICSLGNIGPDLQPLLAEQVLQLPPSWCLSTGITVTKACPILGVQNQMQCSRCGVMEKERGSLSFFNHLLGVQHELFTPLFTMQPPVHVFSLVRITKFNYHFVTRSLGTVKSLSALQVRFDFSKMIPPVNIVVSVSVHLSISFLNILMHCDSSTMSVW